MNAQNSSHLLLIEDDENDILLMQRAFRKAKLNINVDITRDGDAAVEYLERRLSQNSPSATAFESLPWLILLDLKLPRRSGLEVLAWIRQNPQLKVIPIVVLTASSDNTDIIRAYELHANSYVIKPINFGDLVQMVDLIRSYWLEVNTPPILQF